MIERCEEERRARPEGWPECGEKGKRMSEQLGRDVMKPWAVP